MPALLLAIFLCANALAQAVEFQLQQGERWVDTPITMQVVVANAADDAAPPEIAPSPDFTSAVVGAPQRMWQSINGVRRTSTTWSVEMTPRRAGVLTLPQVKVVSGGRPYLSPPQSVSVSASNSDEVLRVKVRSNPASPYVGQAANLVLEIAVRSYANREYDTVFGEGNMWRLIDIQNCSWGVFEPRLRELAQNNQRPSGSEVIRDGAKWCIYEIVSNTNAVKSGPLDIGDVRVEWKYPTGMTVDRDFFGTPQPSLTGIRKVSATPAASNVIVKALPEAGRPASFRGAVGSFDLQASVKPEKAAVGDPMTLTLSIQSLSDNSEELRSLQPPPLDSPALTKGFRMPTDPLAGTIRGSTKIFTQTLRPLSADVKEIPAIEFSYFDPATSKYRTASTRPIPIQVSPSERLSAAALEGVGAAKRDAAKSSLTEVDGGLFANAAPTAALLMDQRLEVGWGAGVIFAAPPILAFALLLVRKRMHASRNNAGLARSRGAAKNARRQLESAGDAASIARSIQAYIEARTGRPEGTVTRSDAKALAREAGATEACLQTLESILALGERASFAAHRGESPQALREQAAKLIAELDALSWRRRTASFLEEIPL
ncbi:MAG: BatD family protein [Planctomycetes bacterium]|nr:BatD family protein [Planctomycetota bacterium]